MPFRTIRASLYYLILSVNCALALVPEEMGFTDLQVRANSLTESGNLIEAAPYLKEIINRVEKSDNKEYDLAYPIFLIGTSSIQEYLRSNNKSALNIALDWYDRLEKEYPKSPHLKPALLKRIDVLRALEKSDAAIELMQSILDRKYSFSLKANEREKLMKDITQIYYGSKRLIEGIPYFNKLMSTAASDNTRVLGAAAKFEALMEVEDYDATIELLPWLTQEAEVRYKPRLNVALLKASDAMVKKARFNDATLILNLIKTTDSMIEYHQTQIKIKQDQIFQRKAIGSEASVIERLHQEKLSLERNLNDLKNLPALKNELLVRRARNYTMTSRLYEAFWMFYDLLESNPNDSKQGEYFYYATFSNARKIGKFKTMLSIGERYRKLYPDGNYYSDITAAMANRLLEEQRIDDFDFLVVRFLDSHPTDRYSPNLLAVWAMHWIHNEELSRIVQQTDKWLSMHSNSIIEDGLYYWRGMAKLQIQDFEAAKKSFAKLLSMHPTSAYAEDALLRKGVSEFYLQDIATARKTLSSYTKKYPSGTGCDQAYYFLGEVERQDGLVDTAISHFNKARSLTKSDQIFDSSSFRIGELLELTNNYEAMRDHFTAYLEDRPNSKSRTKAIIQLGRSMQLLHRPNDMLELYRDVIIEKNSTLNDTGIDELIESYAEKYSSIYTTLKETVIFLDKLKTDAAFRENIITDPGFLFEQFYYNPLLDQTLYNRLRNHPSFGEQLLNSLVLIEDITNPIQEQLEKYPPERPEDLFDQLRLTSIKEGNRIGEIRMLMGLYSCNIKQGPDEPFNLNDLGMATPRTLLFIADHEKENNLEFAIMAWETVLDLHPTDDASIVALTRLSVVNQEKGNTQIAISYLDLILEQFSGSPKIPSVMLHKGELLSKLGDTDSARSTYQYILKVPAWRGKIHAMALLQIADTYMLDKAYAKAHGFYERTFLGYSQFILLSAKAYLGDAQSLLKMGNKSDAISTLTEAINTLSAIKDTKEYRSINNQLKDLL